MSERSKTFVNWAMGQIALQPMVLDIGGGTRFGKWMKRHVN